MHPLRTGRNCSHISWHNPTLSSLGSASFPVSSYVMIVGIVFPFSLFKPTSSVLSHRAPITVIIWAFHFSYLFTYLYTGRNLLPTTRYVPALGSHFYPTLFTAAVCHFFGHISIAPTLGRIITELFRPALWTLLVIGDGGPVAPDNPGSEPWRLTCGQWISD